MVRRLGSRARRRCTLLAAAVLAGGQPWLYGDVLAQAGVVLVPELQIGAVEGPPEVLFGGSIGVIALSDGTILIADRDNNDIRVFRTDGTYSHTIGRSGQGPGEFGRIGSVAVCADSLVTVFDVHNHRLSVFDLGGRLVAAERLPRIPGVQPLVAVHPIGPSRVIGVTAGAISPVLAAHDPNRAWIVMPFPWDLDHPKPDTLAVFRVRAAYAHWQSATGPRMEILGRELGQGGSVAIGTDRVAVVDGGSGVVTIWRLVGDRLVEHQRFRPGIAGQPMTAATRAALERELRASPLFGANRPVGPVTWSVPDYVSATTHAFYGTDGTLWIGRDEDGGEYLIVPSESAIATRIRMPSGFRPTAASGDRLYGVRRDDLGVSYVRVYRFRHLDEPRR